MSLSKALTSKSLKEPEETLEKKANLAGIAAQPSSAVGAKLIGGTQKQQEMAASKQAKIGKSNQLGAALRTQSANIQEGKVEQTEQKSEVQDQISAIGDKLSAARTTKAVQEGLGNLTDINTGEATTKVEAMRQFKNGEITEDQLTAQYGLDVANEIVSGVESQIQDTLEDAALVTASEIFTPDEAAVAAETLGLTPEEFNSLSIEDIENNLRLIEEQELQEVDNMRALLQSPTASAADKQAAREQLRIMGASHLIATDAQMDALINDVNSSQTVELGGQAIPLSDLLTDDRFGGVMSYINDALIVNPDVTAEDLGVDPELFNFVKKHEDVMSSLIEETQGAYADAGVTYQANQEFKNQLGELFDLAGLEEYSVDNYADSDFGNLLSSAQQLNVNTDELFDDISVLAEGEEDPSSFIAGWLTTTLEEGDTDELNRQATVISGLKNARKPSEAISQVVVSETPITRNELQKVLEEAKDFPDAYGGDFGDLIEMIDANGDGVLDDNYKETLTDYIKGGGKKFSGDMFKNPYSKRVTDDFLRDVGAPENLGDIDRSVSSIMYSNDTPRERAAKAQDQLNILKQQLDKINLRLGENPLEFLLKNTEDLRYRLARGIEDLENGLRGMGVTIGELTKMEAGNAEVAKGEAALENFDQQELQRMALTYPKDMANPKLANLGERARVALAEKGIYFDPKLKQWVDPGFIWGQE